MNAPFKMSTQKTSPNSPAATSSPASPAGISPLQKQVGQLIVRFGREVVLASLSPRQAKDAGLLTSGTSGPSGSISSSSADLILCLANRLRASLRSSGSTLFTLTWKVRATPSGRPIFCAAGVGAPHIRQRLWFVADACGTGAGRHAGGTGSSRGTSESPRHTDREYEAVGIGDGSSVGTLAHPNSPRCGEQRSGRLLDRERPAQWDDADRRGRLGNPSSPRLQERERDGRLQREALGPSEGQTSLSGIDAGELGDADGEREVSQPGVRGRPQSEPDGISASFWFPCDWLPCTDGKARPVEPGSFPLASGVQQRASKLRALGNSIVPQVAAEFIKAYLACRP